MASPKNFKAHCNRCGGETNHLSLKLVEDSWGEEVGEGYSIYGANTHNLLKCAGCGEIKLRVNSWFSEDTDVEGAPIVKETFYPPATSRPKPRWFYLLDSQWHITKLFDEVYTATYNGAKSLASMGLRAVIEAVMIDKVGDNKPFAKNLEQFQNQGYVSTIQKNSLLAALELGHASIHRGYEPTDDQLDTAIDIVEGLVHQLYLLSNNAEAAKMKIPKRKA
jgi:hypothetical protein